MPLSTPCNCTSHTLTRYSSSERISDGRYTTFEAKSTVQASGGFKVQACYLAKSILRFTTGLDAAMLTLPTKRLRASQVFGPEPVLPFLLTRSPSQLWKNGCCSDPPQAVKPSEATSTPRPCETPKSSEEKPGQSKQRAAQKQ